jgi:putative OPT family oligopeptide transporter
VAGDRGGSEMKGIFAALALGGLFKALVTVVGLFMGSVEWATRIGRTGLYAGTDISPMLMAVGFIVGWEVALLIFLGGAISFLGAIPVLAWGTDFGAGPTKDVLMGIWDSQIRFVGIGAMVVAGLYSIVKIAGSMGAAFRAAIRSLRGLDDTDSLPRTDRGITGRALFALVAVSLTLSGTVYYMMTGSGDTTANTSITIFVLAFLFVAVAINNDGLVGSSNSPVSGMTICTVLATAGLLLVLGYTGEAGMLATLGVAGVVCCAACTAGDICQDLKIGQIIGATPRALQTGEVLGALVPAIIIAPTMQLLHKAYGIGVPAREGVAALKAPQGVMFEKLVGGIFGADKDLPWNLVGWGALVGVAAILIDRIWLEPRKAKFRLHAMPLAVGMYLPWTVTTPILIGGIVYKVVEIRSKSRGDSPEQTQKAVHSGLLFSSGLVAGEAIMGIVIAGLVIMNLDIPLLKGWSQSGLPLDLVSLGGLLIIIWMLARKALSAARNA